MRLMLFGFVSEEVNTDVNDLPSETTYSRMLDLSTALPSANREYGVRPAPFSCISYRVFVTGFVVSNRLIARYPSGQNVLPQASQASSRTPSPNCDAQDPLPEVNLV